MHSRVELLHWRQQVCVPFDDFVDLAAALVTLEHLDFRTLDAMWRASNQTRIAAAIVTANRLDEFKLLYKYGVLFHTAPPRFLRASAMPSVALTARRRISSRPPSDRGNHSPRKWRVQGGLIWLQCITAQLRPDVLSRMNGPGSDWGTAAISLESWQAPVGPTSEVARHQRRLGPRKRTITGHRGTLRRANRHCVQALANALS